MDARWVCRLFSVLGGDFEKEADTTMFKFALNSLQTLAQPTTTALFLLNPFAHGPREVSSLTGIFANQVAHGEQGLKVVKLES